MDRADDLGVPGDDLRALPLEVVQRIDSLADRFEQELLEGREPNLEAFVAMLTDGGDAARNALRSQLKAVASDESLGSLTRVKVPENTVSWPLQAAGQEMPETIGEYRLLERLGSGGMGVVYKALHTRLGCHVAIKFARLAAALDPTHTQRLLREARTVGRLRHEHIVRALDAGDSPLGPYLVTEYIGGGTAGQLVRERGPLAIDRALELTRQAATALAYSHSQGVVHRDIKPSNILLEDGQVVRLVDFGLAKPDEIAEADTDMAEATHTGVFLGTVAYAAPEQVFPGGQVDQRADAYSLGCVLYFLLTGSAPHGSTLPERLLVDRKAISGALSKALPDVPVRVDLLWRRMVASNPTERFGDMQAVVAEIDRVRLNPGPSASSLVRRRRAVGVAAALVALLSTGWLLLRDEAAAGVPRGPRPAAMIAPFSSQEAADGQKKWAEYLQRPVRVNNSIGMPMVLIPPGEFEMGLSEGSPAPQAKESSWRFKPPSEIESEQLPVHRVRITKLLFFGATEVTRDQFERFVDRSGYVTDAERTEGWGKEDAGWLLRPGYSWKSTGQRVAGPDYPVINVTWNDAVALCEWLTANDDLGVYRLPTEAEWEYACRAGTQTPYFFGDRLGEMGEYACYKENFEGWVDSVAKRRPNPFGLYDVYGNRQEWCADVFSADFYSASPSVDPVNLSDGEERCLRGGTHTDAAWFCTSSRRWSQAADNLGAAGIRVVCEVGLDE